MSMAICGYLTSSEVLVPLILHSAKTIRHLHSCPSDTPASYKLNNKDTCKLFACIVKECKNKSRHDSGSCQPLFLSMGMKQRAPLSLVKQTLCLLSGASSPDIGYVMFVL